MMSSAIEKLPRSLISIGRSIREQTGWCVTIIAGGPVPKNEGQIATLM